MLVLDPRTIERLAALICDLGGPYQRSVRELERFLEAAGWTPDYDGSGRVPWLSETIRGQNEDPEAIESLIRRIIDPREYDEGMPAAQAFVKPLNHLLASDGIQVGHVGLRPVVRRMDDEPDPSTLDQLAAALASTELRETVRSLVIEPEMADILNARLDEVEASRNAGAYLLAVIGTGSFIEGLLHDVLMSRDSVTQAKKKPTLHDLLQRAHECGWIQHDALKFGHLVREYRNLVHPRQQLEAAFSPDSDTVLLCWQPVLAVINDLKALLPSLRTQGTP